MLPKTLEIDQPFFRIRTNYRGKLKFLRSLFVLNHYQNIKNEFKTFSGQKKKQNVIFVKNVFPEKHIKWNLKFAMIFSAGKI